MIHDKYIANRDIEAGTPLIIKGKQLLNTDGDVIAEVENDDCCDFAKQMMTGDLKGITTTHIDEETGEIIVTKH